MPTGTATVMAMATRMPEPMIALATPPPRTPGGEGSCVKKLGVSFPSPFTSRCARMITSGTMATRAANQVSAVMRRPVRRRC
jgi:hypothetical protein